MSLTRVEQSRQAGLSGWTAERRARDAERMRVVSRTLPFEVRSAHGVMVNEPRYSCGTCGLVSTAMGIGNHQRRWRQGHVGRTLVEP
jgi:hypothetical protein